MNITGKDFGLKKERDHIVGARNKDNYVEYQYQYRREFGVFPELDTINNPFIAPWDDIYGVLCSLRKRGFYGAWFFHDIHGGFNKRLTKIYEKYKYEWSFVASLNHDWNEFITGVSALPVGENVVNGLGYKKDENGIYYEGTWKNGKLVYGLLYKQTETDSLLFVGDFNNDEASSMNGVMSIMSHNNRNTMAELNIGNIHIKKDNFNFYNGSTLSLNTEIKNSEIISMDATISEYSDGYCYGKVFSKNFSNNDINVSLRKYKKNGEVKGVGAWGIIWRIYIGILMMVYFMLKYTYGLLFFPIYRAIKKKNWK